MTNPPSQAADLSRQTSFPPIHVFQHRGKRFVYFVRTGDCAEVNEPSFDALALIEKGAQRAEVIHSLESRWSATEMALVLHDLDALYEMGYMDKEKPLSKEQVRQACRRLFRHKPRNIMFLVTEACNLACTY